MQIRSAYQEVSKYLLNIPATQDSMGNPLPGVLLVISRDAPFKVETVYQVDPTCVGNAGLTIGPDHQVLLGCGSGNGPGTGSVIIDDRNGKTLIKLPNQFGDEIWYNPGDNQYFLTGDTSLGVVDPSGNQDASAPTNSAGGSHSVAADMIKNQVYVPVNSAGTLCGTENGCIAVFTAKKDDKCLTGQMPILRHKDGDDPVFMRPPCNNGKGPKN